MDANMRMHSMQVSSRDFLLGMEMNNFEKYLKDKMSHIEEHCVLELCCIAY